MQTSVLPALADPLFQSQIAPQAAYPHPAWREARAAALDALVAGGVTLLLGRPGSGKSLMLKDLARTLRQAGTPVCLADRAGALDGAPEGAIILVDEADTLDADALAALCAGPAPVLFAALPGFPARLAGHAGPVHRVLLGRLQPQDVARYVAARLAAVGRPRDLLEPEAVLALARHSGGLLRLVNTLGGAAVFLAGLDGSPHVALRHVEEAVTMRDHPEDHGDFGDDVVLPEADPPPAPAVAPLDYRGATLRRRAVLGTMFAASGALFTLPWLSRGRHVDQPPLQAEATGPAIQVAQNDAAPAPAPMDNAASAETNLPDAPAQQPEPLRPEASPPAEVQAPAEVAAAPPNRAERVRRADPAPPAAPTGDRRVPAAPVVPVRFQGPIFNETMGQGGHVTLVIQKQAQAGAITARFNASQGLSGAGVLAGSVSDNGRLTASGQLLMGRNPFMCDLSGTLNGDMLTGSASFVRNGTVYHSRFALVRA